MVQDSFTKGAPETEPERQKFFLQLGQDLVSERSRALGRSLTASVQTFGCQMNARDSEKLRGMLEALGYTEADSEKADLVLYNTCTVRENANTRVYGRLGYLHRLKKDHPAMMIGLCGCMMQEPTVIETLRESFSFVDLVFGTHNLYRFPELFVRAFLSDQMVIEIQKDADRIVEEIPMKRKYAFKSGVNITYGCNNFCSYCIVPYVRGRERSRKQEDILAEIRSLVDDGVKEVMLLGQNVDSYGKTLDEPVSFAELLRNVEQIEGLERIRFMTSHPKDLSQELIDVMKNSDKICRHLHLPLQSGSTRVLERMNRKYTKERYLELASAIREAMPDLALTTDIIVGFPGETEEDFQETLDVVRTVRFDSAFTFLYSKRTGTRAAVMPDQIPEDVAKERFGRLLELVQTIAGEEAAGREGITADVLVESVNEHDSSLVTGRLSNNMIVHFPGSCELIGTIVPVRLSKCKGFYYLGERV